MAKHIRNRQPHKTMEEWRNSPQNARNNPKLSPEDAQRITDEAIAGGQIWDALEKINARRRAGLGAECGQDLVDPGEGFKGSAPRRPSPSGHPRPGCRDHQAQGGVAEGVSAPRMGS